MYGVNHPGTVSPFTSADGAQWLFHLQVSQNKIIEEWRCPRPDTSHSLNRTNQVHSRGQNRPLNTQTKRGYIVVLPLLPFFTMAIENQIKQINTSRFWNDLGRHSLDYRRTKNAWHFSFFNNCNLLANLPSRVESQINVLNQWFNKTIYFSLLTKRSAGARRQG